MPRKDSLLASLRAAKEEPFVLDTGLISRLLSTKRDEHPVDYLSGQQYWQIDEMIASKGEQVVFEISGIAAKNEANISVVLYLYARIISGSDGITRRAALAGLKHVMKTSRDVLEFVYYYNQMLRGWSRATRGAVAAWYLDSEPRMLLARCLTQPEWRGWNHKDVMRLVHPKPETAYQRETFRCILAIYRSSDAD